MEFYKLNTSLIKKKKYSKKKLDLNKIKNKLYKLRTFLSKNKSWLCKVAKLRAV